MVFRVLLRLVPVINNGCTNGGYFWCKLSSHPVGNLTGLYHMVRMLELSFLSYHPDFTMVLYWDLAIVVKKLGRGIFWVALFIRSVHVSRRNGETARPYNGIGYSRIMGGNSAKKSGFGWCNSSWAYDHGDFHSRFCRYAWLNMPTGVMMEMLNMGD